MCVRAGVVVTVQIIAMTSVVVLIAVDPSDQAEAAFNCESVNHTSSILLGADRRTGVAR